MICDEVLVRKLFQLDMLCKDHNQRVDYYKGKLDEYCLYEKIYLHYISEIEGILEELGKDEGLDCLLFFENQLDSFKEQSEDMRVKLNSLGSAEVVLFQKFEDILNNYDESELETYVSELCKGEFEETWVTSERFPDLTVFLKNNLNRFIMEEEDMICLQMNLKN